MAVAHCAALAGVVTYGMCRAQLRAHFVPRHAGLLAFGAVARFGQHLEVERFLAHASDHVHDSLHHTLLARAAGGTQ